jgi:hypothetical protein
MAGAIHPTHTCFDDALDFFVHIKPRAIHEYVVVHALVTLPGQSDVFAHAWVEQLPERLVIQGGIVNGRRCYYALPTLPFTIVKSSRYTALQALQLNAIHEHFGPWRREYKDACAHGAVIVGALQPSTPVHLFFTDQ